jgi:hypothetical protein
MAMMNGAIYDCFQSIRRTHEPLRYEGVAPVTASRPAAVTEAAYRILVAMYPGESSWLRWAHGYNLSLVAEGTAKDEGVALGRAVAEEYLAWREGDRADELVPYFPGTGAGEWRPDPRDTTQVAWGPGWGTVATFCLTGSRQFPVPPPPALGSVEYAEAWQEVREYGAKQSAVRTADQLEVGIFWAYDRSGLGPPPVLYSRNLHEIATQRGNSEAQNARLFAMASVAMADAAIACWDSKFDYNLWRPITAIREADTDGNEATQKQADWEPYGMPGGGIFANFTPPFPAYVSGHASMGSALFGALRAFYDRDEVAFSLTSDELPGVTRHFGSFSEADQENADSRVWLGVHWRFDQTEGQVLGGKVAEYVSGAFFQAIPGAGEDIVAQIAGPEAGVGYVPMEMAGSYEINGRLEIRMAPEFLSAITSEMSFMVLTCTGSLSGLPLNVQDGRVQTADGYGSLRVTAMPQALVLDDFQLAEGVLETFATFASAHGLSGEVEADTDGDGSTDYAEYAFGLDPRAFDRPPAAVLETIDGERCLVIRYVRRTGRLLAGLVMEAQQSADLADWNTDGVLDEIDPESPPINGGEPRRARVPVPATGPVFLRLWAQR